MSEPMKKRNTFTGSPPLGHGLSAKATWHSLDSAIVDALSLRDGGFAVWLARTLGGDNARRLLWAVCILGTLHLMPGQNLAAGAAIFEMLKDQLSHSQGGGDRTREPPGPKPGALPLRYTLQVKEPRLGATRTGLRAS